MSAADDDVDVEVLAWGVDGRAVDLGAMGRAWLGVPRGGAADAPALRLANRLVGNDDGACGLETAGGLVVRLRRAAVVSATGSLAEVIVDGGPPVGWGAPVAMPAGAVVRVRRLLDGARAYLALRGGVTPVGDSGLRLGREPSRATATVPAVPPARPERVRLWPGPRLDHLEPDAFERLQSVPLRVESTSRVGCRLGGIRLRHLQGVGLESEGVVEGAVQVPPDGSPIVMLADHPTTGGYPVVAVVEPEDLWVLAQAIVGSSVRFGAAVRRGRSG